jgi:hypothetical protein
MGGRSVNVDGSRDVRKNLGSTQYHIWALPLFCPGWITWAQIVYVLILKLRITCAQVVYVLILKLRITCAQVVYVLILKLRITCAQVVLCLVCTLSIQLQHGAVQRSGSLSLCLSPSLSCFYEYRSFTSCYLLLLHLKSRWCMHSHLLLEPLTLLLTSNIEC